MSDPFADATLLEDFTRVFDQLFPLCRPRLLIVTDGELNFSTGGFGLSRFVAAIQDHWARPLLSLAHRNRATETVTIDGVSYKVAGSFNFATASPSVSLENYDQIWLFGYMTGITGPLPDRLEDRERLAIAQFMTAGGGVFATGDHGMLGQGMCGELLRIRSMRAWDSIPMGTEGNATAENRIDTILNTGANDLYEFDDQSDFFPQRIYPNYRVTWSNQRWSASIHPLLRLPWSRRTRIDNKGFRSGTDIEVLPDHAHESVCLEPAFTALNATYRVLDFSFREFPLGPVGFVVPEVVASAVSAGRAVSPNPLSSQPIWKPPVKPRMFAIITAWDGHAARGPFGTTPGPGRIVCDSTWHHFVNYNIDGGGSGRSGLGTGFGADWVPSADCNKIFRYFQNIVTWLQPEARVFCNLLQDLIIVRFHPSLIEELMEVPSFKDPHQFEALGAEAVRLIETERGDGAAADAVRSALRSDPGSAGLTDSEHAAEIWSAGCGPGWLLSYTLGRALAQVAETVPSTHPDQLKKCLRDHRKLEGSLRDTLVASAREAVGFKIQRVEDRLKRLSALAAYAPRKNKAKT